MDQRPITTIHQTTIEKFIEQADMPDRYHAVFCDPPYGLGADINVTELIRAWLNDDDGAGSQSKGFMNKEWDIIPPPSVWRGIREKLVYSGAVLFCFGGTRTSDLLSLSIRLGGWVKFDEILHWSYGEGYPKVYDIGKAVAKAGLNFTEMSNRNSWEGYATLLKPAQEPIMCFRAPFDDTYVERVLSDGSSTLNIDAARIDGGGYDSRTFGRGWRQDKSAKEVYAGGWAREGRHTSNGSERGRWPANLVLTHLPGCRPTGKKAVRSSKPRVQKHTQEYDANSRAGAWTHPEGLVTSGFGGQDGKETIIEWECVKECPVKELSEQSGHLKSGSAPKTPFRKSDKHSNTYNDPNGLVFVNESSYRADDEGTAARYFLQAHWAYETYETIKRAPIAFYQAKASKKEKNAGIMSEAITTDDGRKKAIDNPYQRGKTLRKNNHPTVKPIELCKWLASLLLPSVDIGERRILIPYSGSGSEAIGAVLAGWDSITAVESEDHYASISRERIDFWRDYISYGGSDISEILDSISNEKEDEPKQMWLFQ